MIKVENVEVFNIARAIYSARNALNSWDKSDSDLEHNIVGEKDLDLAHRLYVAGPVHRKYLRQIFVTMDITAPFYWWKEESQYKVGTTTNSCSTMHTIHKRPLTLDDFSHEHLDTAGIATLQSTIERINLCRKYYIGEYDNVMDVLEDGMTKKDYWWHMIQLLPSSFNQRRTLTMSYETVMNMLDWRSDHKLDEWKTLCDILRTLPYIKEIRGEADELCE